MQVFVSNIVFLHSVKLRCIEILLLFPRTRWHLILAFILHIIKIITIANKLQTTKLWILGINSSNIVFVEIKVFQVLRIISQSHEFMRRFWSFLLLKATFFFKFRESLFLESFIHKIFCLQSIKIQFIFKGNVFLFFKVRLNLYFH